MSHISVIVPSFNQASYISDCLSSILTQTKKPREIIVVDDASTDNTIEVIKPYLAKIKLIQNRKNFGAFSYTANIGIKHSKGDYIAILSADDWLAPTMLEEEAAILDKNPQIGLVYSQAISVEGSKKILIVHKPAGHASYIGRPNDFKLLLTEGDFIPSINTLVRKSVFTKLGLFDINLRYMVDYEMWIRIARKYKLAYIAKPLTFYRVHGDNLHLNPDFAKITQMEFLYILKKYFPKKVNGVDMFKIKRLAYYNYYLRSASYEIFANNSKKAIQFWFKALKMKPSSILTYKALQPAYFAARKFISKTSS